MESTLTLLANKKAELQTKAKELQTYVDQLTAVQKEIALIKQIEKAVATEPTMPDMKALGREAADAKQVSPNKPFPDLEKLVAQYKANFRKGS